MKSTLVSLALTAILGGAGVVATAPTAQAAVGCTGRVIDVASIMASGTKIGEVHLYWDSARGTNCTVVRHGGPTWGVTLPTTVKLTIARGYMGEVLTWPGNYAYSAWGDNIKGVDWCATAIGEITWKGQVWRAQTDTFC